MTVFDGVLLGIFLVSMFLGAWRGFVFELFSLIGWVVGFLAARFFASYVAAWLPLANFDFIVQYSIGFLLTFVVAVFAWGLISALAKKFVEVVGLRPVDRALGAAFGLLRAAALTVVLTVVVVSTPLHEQIWWAQSAVAPWLTSAVASILPALSVNWGALIPSA